MHLINWPKKAEGRAFLKRPILGDPRIDWRRAENRNEQRGYRNPHRDGRSPVCSLDGVRLALDGSRIAPHQLQLLDWRASSLRSDSFSFSEIQFAVM